MCATCKAVKHLTEAEQCRVPCRFQFVYPLSSIFILLLTVPSSASSYFSYGDTLLDNANVFGVLPASPARSFAVSLESSDLLAVYSPSAAQVCMAAIFAYTSGVRCCCHLLDDAVPGHVIPDLILRHEPWGHCCAPAVCATEGE